MTGMFGKSIKTNRAAMEMHRVLQCAWDGSKFSGGQAFEVGYNVPQQMALQSGKI